MRWAGAPAGPGTPPADIAGLLRVRENAEVVIRSRRYLLDGKPVETSDLGGKGLWGERPERDSNARPTA